MSLLLFKSALFFVLLATGGFIVYLIRQQKSVYRSSYWILFAGFICLTLFFAQQYHDLGVAPVLNMKSALSFSWGIIGAYLILQLKFRLMVLGSFVAPFAAFLMLLSSTIPGVDMVVKPMYRSTWLTIHIGTMFIGNGMFAVTFLTAIMYLLQERQIKRKKLGAIHSRLPSLQTLDSINYYSLVYGFPLLTIGMITGSIYAQYALGSYWRWDPKETWSLITWLFYAALLHERVAVGWRGRRASIMSIICFLMLLFLFFGVSLWLSDYHSFSSLGGQTGI
jgi:cytochrome c-type biogenesis protein CcsB